MTKRRHSTIQFNPTEWLADTARMPRVVRSVLFDLACYTYERVAPVPAAEVFLMVSDLPDGQGEAIIENLVQGKHLERGPDGAVFSPKAMAEAQRAYALWEAKSRGGRGGAPTLLEEPDDAPQEPVEQLERVPAPIVEQVGAPQIADAWNRVASRTPGLKQITKMTDERLNRLNARIAEHGAEAILSAIEGLATNELVLSTKPSFDTLLQPETCAKMIAAACGEASGQTSGEGSA